MTEVKLDSSEVRDLQHQANMYALIKTVEHLERAFVNGRVSEKDYEEKCFGMIAQFRTLQGALKDKYPDLREFMRENRMDCTLAADRLLGSGLPATRLYASGQGASESDGRQRALQTFRVSGCFITLLDALKLGEKAVDGIQPLVVDLVSKINQISDLPPELEGVARVKGWVYTLNQMSASDDLSESQLRQVTHDVDLAYSAFENWLQSSQQ
uniref:Vacuolar protein sorting-associated protein 28 homolog n=1 Tax=Chromera velia CCMP2878 TaxID=1169474 RepID=A0A0G4I4Y1_9ALVE|mmetsp:Transcript_7566/g.14745  ORF Transcript_7566/g.14745 Transcript_7566/m.14745 type:complete len:212 (+) Transcript_7566:222-857(+)|eukprot:Cvel_11034.t1-p1 / transcript=Cvel_11034.t1 / gene=Cvel_11034 / organism=Chromera_velia_CCMP2878 / gene_product=Vacuolar protein sorting-associated protein 28, putative / transcript_product=Vacuolar protein sorting-associated protein 28, putative / location=Cvel_scaffold680:47219-50622(+) / protein_length=211 / sequence_SO=supercontig / SO=protein_coding / is_pseudo=false